MRVIVGAAVGCMVSSPDSVSAGVRCRLAEGAPAYSPLHRSLWVMHSWAGSSTD